MVVSRVVVVVEDVDVVVVVVDFWVITGPVFHGGMTGVSVVVEVVGAAVVVVVDVVVDGVVVVVLVLVVEVVGVVGTLIR